VKGLLFMFGQKCSNVNKSNTQSGTVLAAVIGSYLKKYKNINAFLTIDVPSLGY
jgi:hypothetical protein